ncbi:unnamed protein product [Phytomonas sp. Hart1]|nr:unnamed protein product [Phytomonas sp. Hart1]|eukprot:CCW70903.1 unnamed protein product [Phytomonas sp. isolate Hart1]
MPEGKFASNTVENPLGLNAILEAVINGDLGFLLAHLTPRNANSADGVHRLPALHWALALGRLPSLRLLLANGASIFALDGLGFSSLHRAVWGGDPALVRTLLFLSPLVGEDRPTRGENTIKGSDPTGENDTKDNTTKGSDTRRSDTTGDHTRDGTRGENAIRGGARRRAPTWRAGAQRLVNLPHAATGRTPLLLAAICGNIEVVRMLLDECGAELSVVDRNGFSALDLAALCGHASLVSMLIEESEFNQVQLIPQRCVESIHEKLRQRVEDFCETAKCLQQREQLDEINRIACMPLASQSFAASQ